MTPTLLLRTDRPHVFQDVSLFPGLRRPRSPQREVVGVPYHLVLWAPLVYSCVLGPGPGPWQTKLSVSGVRVRACDTWCASFDSRLLLWS